jgi:hypothetical protein
MKRELQTDTVACKKIRLTYDSRVNDVLSRSENELEAECNKIIKDVESDITKVSSSLTRKNNTITEEATKNRANQMCMCILNRKSEVDERTSNFNTIAAENRSRVDSLFRNLVSGMCELTTTQEVEDNLIRQLNLLSEECRMSADLINQARADGLSKMNMWKHMYVQLSSIRKINSEKRKE